MRVHDYSRGIDGSLSAIVAGIGNLARAKRKYGGDFPIIVKAVVHKLNFRQLPDLVNWVQEIGATAVNLQPVEQHTEEAKDEFWIEPDELDELVAVKDRLITMKRAGAPIPQHRPPDQSVAEPFPPRKSAARGYALPRWHAKLFHSLGRPGRDLLELAADRQCAHGGRA
jgi:MoaA/NifB/PqqE/SkfB family radical SAM enzyme